MKLMELKDVVKKTVRKKKKGKKVEPEQIQTVLTKLEEKQKDYEKRYANPSSDKEKKKLEYHRKVVKAQIEKARKLLADLDELDKAADV